MQHYEQLVSVHCAGIGDVLFSYLSCTYCIYFIYWQFTLLLPVVSVVLFMKSCVSTMFICSPV